jgi:uncharacterized membrane protein
MNGFGSRVYGLAAIVLGVTGIAFDDYAAVWQPVPKTWPAHDLLAYVSGAILLIGGVASFVPKTARVGALVLAAFYGLWVLALKLPPVVQHPGGFEYWHALSEVLGISMGGVLAFALNGGFKNTEAAMRGARVIFGVCCVAYGAAHFVFLKATNSFIPTWMPLSPTFWSYLTGAGHIAAGLALITGVQARLAAVLLTAMFVVFGALVHFPLLLKDAHDHFAWCANGINGALIGVAWCAADSLRNRAKA